ncbi:phosphotransferase [Isoptericola sp. NPDC057391]|uniref:phosphotransferase n=1 Tax=Isoptericola sp. NPDC057391 TaxID=3346117 RepID=UPI003632C681
MELIAAGRDADVFALDDRRVLRRYRDGRPAHQDAGLLGAVVDAGYPAPAVLGVDGPGMVLERLSGPTLADELLAGRCDAGEAGAILASLHARLHALPWPDGPLLHLDLHPSNVVLAGRGPVVIDWTDARTGPAGLDVATTALILAQTVLSPADATVQGAADVVAGVASAVLRAFVAATGPGYRDHLDEAVARRRAVPMMTDDELERMDDARALAARAS